MYRSSDLVTRQRDDATRSACTTIVFLLVAETQSEWHRVMSDEVWHFYEGDALELATREEVVVLDADHRVHVIPAGAWQSARPLGEYALVGCTVAPGFEWEDFALSDSGQ